jgi:hypothetical protein
MTFLQYACERLLGPPARRGGSAGESYWCCPFHNDTNPSLHTMPHKPQYKDRWMCFGCGMRGDEADLMAGLIRGENYQHRRQRLDQWRQDYEREVEAQATPVGGAAKVFASGERGVGGGGKRQDHPSEVAAAWGNLTATERDTLLAAHLVMQGKTVSFEALAQYCADFVEWMRQPEEPTTTGGNHQRNGTV